MYPAGIGEGTGVQLDSVAHSASKGTVPVLPSAPPAAQYPQASAREQEQTHNAEQGHTNSAEQLASESLLQMHSTGAAVSAAGLNASRQAKVDRQQETAFMAALSSNHPQTQLKNTQDMQQKANGEDHTLSTAQPQDSGVYRVYAQNVPQSQPHVQNLAPKPHMVSAYHQGESAAASKASAKSNNKRIKKQKNATNGPVRLPNAPPAAPSLSASVPVPASTNSQQHVPNSHLAVSRAARGNVFYTVQVPPNALPGSELTVQIHDEACNYVVPPGAQPGNLIVVRGPPPKVDAAVVNVLQNVPRPSSARPAASPPPVTVTTEENRAVKRKRRHAREAVGADKTHKDANAVKHPRPKGRAPSNCVWDALGGQWVHRQSGAASKKKKKSETRGGAGAKDDTGEDADMEEAGEGEMGQGGGRRRGKRKRKAVVYQDDQAMEEEEEEASSGSDASQGDRMAGPKRGPLLLRKWIRVEAKSGASSGSSASRRAKVRLLDATAEGHLPVLPAELMHGDGFGGWIRHDALLAAPCHPERTDLAAGSMTREQLSQELQKNPFLHGRVSKVHADGEGVTVRFVVGGRLFEGDLAKSGASRENSADVERPNGSGSGGAAGGTPAKHQRPTGVIQFLS